MDPDEFDLRIRVWRKRDHPTSCHYRPDHGSELAASFAAAEVKALRGITVEAFPCSDCGGWHLGPPITDKERHGTDHG